MEEIVSNDIYADMPNARTDGRINWQVSSGKTTSFYAYYEARWKWWERKADELHAGRRDMPRSVLDRGSHYSPYEVSAVPPLW